MPYVLGIDTGGTYTDSVVISTSDRLVLSKAKSFTTKENLVIGIRNSIQMLQLKNADEIDMVCLSTTLATNAIVENKTARAGLLLIGKQLDTEFPDLLCEVLRGKLDIKGREVIALDRLQIEHSIEHFRGEVEAMAISGYASIRNPKQELFVKKMVRERLDVPVVCAHELTVELGYQERTATAVFNARLIPVIKELLEAVKVVLAENSICAPLMVVKGDGSLVREEYVVDRPIETILSGPAASIVGGAFLSGVDNALVLDMGGTTTDTACLHDGKVGIEQEGAIVEGMRTRVKAAEIVTYGLGGDSYIRIDQSSNFIIGPGKVKPLCVAAAEFPYLAEELAALPNGTADCVEVYKAPKGQLFNKAEDIILNELKEGPHSIQYLLYHNDAIEKQDIERMEKKGYLRFISMTPTDILHATGEFRRWNEHASLEGLRLLSRQARMKGEMVLKIVVAVISEKLKSVCRGAKTVVAIGAPVRAWLPSICQQLNIRLIIPEHAEVANAVGAATGQVMYTTQVLIRPGAEHRDYIVYAPWERRSFPTFAGAKDYAKAEIEKYCTEMMRKAGACNHQISIKNEDTYAETYVETRISATCIGSPDWF